MKVALTQSFSVLTLLMKEAFEESFEWAGSKHLPLSSSAAITYLRIKAKLKASSRKQK